MYPRRKDVNRIEIPALTATVVELFVVIFPPTKQAKIHEKNPIIRSFVPNSSSTAKGAAKRKVLDPKSSSVSAVFPPVQTSA